MMRYFARRLAGAAVTMASLSVIVFLLAHFSGDGALMMAPVDASEEQLAWIRSAMGLDLPLHLRYGKFMRMMFQGRLGVPFDAGHSLWEMLWPRVGATLLLAAATMILIVVAGFVLGLLGAVYRGKTPDLLLRVVTAFGQATPAHLAAILLILVASRKFPGTLHLGVTSWKMVWWPALAAAVAPGAEAARHVRGVMLHVAAQPYVQFARAKGLTPLHIGKHILRNGLIPILAVLGTRLHALIGGAAVIETVFAWPGLGSFALQAVHMHNVPLLLACLLVVGGLITAASVAADAAYVFIDPRLHRNGGGGP